VSFNKPNFFIFTGGPGAGKTSVLDELSAMGYQAVEEVARKIIKEQNQTGGNATHDGDQQAFCELMLAAAVQDYKDLIESSRVFFFDRGVPGLAGYSTMTAGQVSAAVQEASSQYRYNPIVFCFPPWEEIYQNDAERQQDFAEAVRTYRVLKQAHEDLGYVTVEVPKVSVAERVQFILSYVENAMRIKNIRKYQGERLTSEASFSGCLILTHDNRILLQKRGENWSSFPGCLSAFGGQIEGNEAPIDAMIRELHEELGAQVNAEELVLLGAITEFITEHQEVVHEFFWHDKHNTITGCYEGEAEHFDSIGSLLSTAKLMDDVVWMAVLSKQLSLW